MNRTEKLELEYHTINAYKKGFLEVKEYDNKSFIELEERQSQILKELEELIS